MFKGYMPHIVFGEGVLSEIGTIVKGYGSKAMLAVDPYLEQNGVAQRIETLLKESGIDTVRWSKITPNPPCFFVDEAGETARDFGVDVIVAVGGGSAIDFGKAVSVIAVNPGGSWEYTERSDHVEGTKRPENRYLSLRYRQLQVPVQNRRLFPF